MLDYIGNMLLIFMIEHPIRLFFIIAFIALAITYWDFRRYVKHIRDNNKPRDKHGL